MSVRILISDPNQEWCREVEAFFVQQNYIVDMAHNGKDAQLKIYKSKYSAVILDLDLNDNHSFQVLKYIKFNAPSLRVIFTLSSRDRMNDLGLVEDDLKNLGISDLLIRPFPINKLLNSVSGQVQFEAWKNIKKPNQPGEEEESFAPDEEFTRIEIDSFYSGNAAIFDLYVRLGSGRYVKVLNRGDFFEHDRIEMYKKEKRVQFLYFKTKDRGVFINFINTVLEKLIESNKAKASLKLNLAKSLVEKYVEEVYMEGIKPQVVEEGKRLCNNIFNLVEKQKDLYKVVREFQDKEPNSYSHFFLVGLFSSIICNQLKWGSKVTMETVVLGALFHDIGMLKLPSDLQKISIEDMSKAQFETFKTHPLLGSEMLSRYPIITSQVRQVIYQHHEHIDGSGFPKGIAGLKIFPLAKIVGFADAFSDFITQRRISPLKGMLEVLQNADFVQKFDADVIRAFGKGLVDSGKSK